MNEFIYELGKAIWLLVLLNLSLYGCLYLYQVRKRSLAAERRKQWREEAAKEMSEFSNED